jgi:predicted ATP-grasp superfamily ATP-dependent carboligase
MAARDLVPSWAAEGAWMRRTLALDLASVEGVSVVMSLDARLPPEPGPWTIIRVEPGQEESRFLREAGAADRTLVIAPETEGCLEWRSHWIRDAGGSSLGSTPEAIALTADKLELARHFVRRNIRTPPTRRFSRLEGLPRDFRYPAVLKPIDGAGSLATILIDSADDQDAIADFPHPAGVLQPYLPDQPMSAGFLIGEEGTARLIALAEQRIVAQEGKLRYEGGRILADQQALDGHVLRSVQSVKGLRGFVGVDYLWDDERKQATVIEINPRPTTSICSMIQELGPGVLATAWLRVLDEDRVGHVPGADGLRIKKSVVFSIPSCLAANEKAET